MPGVDVDRCVNEVLASRKNSSKIDDLISLIQTDDKQQLKCLRGLEKIFTTFLERNEFHVDPNLKITNKKDWEAESKYTKWLREKYENTQKICYKLLDSDEEQSEDECLAILLKLSSTEVQYSSKSNSTLDNSVFPENTLEQILRIIFSDEFRKKSLINCFEKYAKCKDVYFYTWKILRKMLQNFKFNDINMLNILNLIEKIPIVSPKAKNIEDLFDGTLCTPKDGKEFIINFSQVQKFVTKVWQILINNEMSDDVYRALMIVLLEKFLPHLEKPIFMTDFFINYSGKGGAEGLLALQGILTLVQKHNIEYPNIYGKLYTMFEPNIFHTRYKSRLFYLADIFLSSTHLPEGLVASFAKRVSRLCLHAQVPDIIISIRFVENLIRRHPGLKKMIHHPDGGHVKEDPFLANEEDPMKTKAIDSCLWEMAMLKNHAQPSVSSLAHFIDKSLSEIEFNLRDVLDTTYEEIFEKEARKKTKACLNISRPEKIAKLSDDRVYKWWSLS